MGKRIKFLREFNGLTRAEFGGLFLSKESTVYEWELGYCVPRLVKLMNIAVYFGVSLDCILSGRAVGETVLEKRLSRAASIVTFGDASAYHPGKLLAQFNALTGRRKDRLVGYMEALCREDESG